MAMSSVWQQHSKKIEQLGLLSPSARPSGATARQWCDRVSQLSGQKYSCAASDALDELFSFDERNPSDNDSDNVPPSDKQAVFLHHTAGYSPPNWKRVSAAAVDRAVHAVKKMYHSDDEQEHWQRFEKQQQKYHDSLDRSDTKLIDFYSGNGFKPISYYVGKWFDQSTAARKTFDIATFLNLLPGIGDRSMHHSALRPALRAALSYLVARERAPMPDEPKLFSTSRLSAKDRTLYAESVDRYLQFAAKDDAQLWDEMTNVAPQNLIVLFELMFVALIGRLQQVVLAAPALPFTAVTFRGAPKRYRSPPSVDFRCFYVTSTLMSTSFYPHMASMFLAGEDGSHMLRIVLPAGLPLLFIPDESEALLPRNLCLAALTRERPRTIFDNHNTASLLAIQQTDFAVIDGPARQPNLQASDKYTFEQVARLLRRAEQTEKKKVTVPQSSASSWWQWVLGTSP